MAEIASHQRPAAPLHRQHPTGAIQEREGLLLAHDLVRAVMAAATATVGVPPVRRSFLGARRVIRAAAPDLLNSTPQQQRHCYRYLLADCGAVALPPRANRLAPRGAKQQQSSYPAKRFPEALVLLR